MGEKLKGVIQVFLNVVTRFVTKAANMIVFIILARELSTNDMGRFGLLSSSAFVLSTFWDCGLRNSIAFYVGQRQEKLRSIVSCALWMFPVLAFGISVSVLVLVLINFIDIDGGKNIFFAIIFVVSLLTIRIFQGVLIGIGKLNWYNFSELTSRSCLLVCTVFYVYFGEIDIETVLFIFGFSYSLGALTTLVGVDALRYKLHQPDFKLFWELLSRGLYFMFGVFAIQLLSRFNVFILSVYEGSAEVGVVFSLQRISEIITELGLAVSLVLFSYNVREADQSKIILNTFRSIRFSLLILIPISIVFIFQGYNFVYLLIGSQYTEFVWLLKYTIVGTLVGSVWVILQPSVSALQPPQKILPFLLPAIVFSMLVSWGLTAKFGIIGSAASLIFNNFALSFVFLFFCKVKFSVSFWDCLVIKRSDCQLLLQAVKRQLKK